MNDLLQEVRCKPDLYQLFNKLGFVTGVEIGVLRGMGSEQILHSSKVDRLYSIDYWDHEDKSDLSNYEDYQHAVARLFKYKSRNVILKMDANEAANLFADNSICFVYIDAGLTYDLYLEHVEAWWSKVKPGGILSGHIFQWVNQGGKHEETDAPERAAIFFCEKYGLEMRVVIDRPIPPNADPASFRGSRSWIVMKPAEVVPSA